MTQTDAEFWSCEEDCEVLSHIDISEAVEEWADNLHPEPLPETVTVYGFDHIELRPSEKLAASILESVLERLDEDFGCDDDYTRPTPAMEAAALAFATVLRAEYRVWRCEQVAKEVVRVADHVPAEWLTPAEAKP